MLRPSQHIISFNAARLPKRFITPGLLRQCFILSLQKVTGVTSERHISTVNQSSSGSHRHYLFTQVSALHSEDSVCLVCANYVKWWQWRCVFVEVTHLIRTQILKVVLICSTKYKFISAMCEQ
jgi:hypothetical protein